MFPPEDEHPLVCLRDEHKFWQYEPEGRRIIKLWLPYEEELIINGQWPNIPIETILTPTFYRYFRGVDDVLKSPEEVIGIDDEQLQAIGDGNLTRDSASQRRGPPFCALRRVCLDLIFVARPSTFNLKMGVSGLEHLSSIESARRSTLRQLAGRLQIESSTWQTALRRNIHALRFVGSMIAKERRVQSLYARAFVDLRIWMMISELENGRFDKYDAIALLNTIFPLSPKELPGDSITKDVLRKHRHNFLGYILAVESDGTRALGKLRQWMTGNTWERTRDALIEYFDLAELMVSQSSEIKDISFFQNMWRRPFNRPFSHRGIPIVDREPRRQSFTRENIWDCSHYKSQSNLYRRIAWKPLPTIPPFPPAKYAFLEKPYSEGFARVIIHTIKSVTNLRRKSKESFHARELKTAHKIENRNQPAVKRKKSRLFLRPSPIDESHNQRSLPKETENPSVSESSIKHASDIPNVPSIISCEEDSGDEARSEETITIAPKAQKRKLKHFMSMGKIRSKIRARRKKNRDSTALSEDDVQDDENDIEINALPEDEYLALRQVAVMKAKAGHKRKRAAAAQMKPYTSQGNRVFPDLKRIQEHQKILNEINLNRARQLKKEEDEALAALHNIKQWKTPVLKFLKNFAGGYSQEPDIDRCLVSKKERELELKKAAEKEAEPDYLDSFGAWIFDETEAIFPFVNVTRPTDKSRTATASKSSLGSKFSNVFRFRAASKSALVLQPVAAAASKPTVIPQSATASESTASADTPQSVAASKSRASLQSADARWSVAASESTASLQSADAPLSVAASESLASLQSADASQFADVPQSIAVSKSIASLQSVYILQSDNATRSVAVSRPSNIPLSKKIKQPTQILPSPRLPTQPEPAIEEATNLDRLVLNLESKSMLNRPDRSFLNTATPSVGFNIHRDYIETPFGTSFVPGPRVSSLRARHTPFAGVPFPNQVSLPNVLQSLPTSREPSSVRAMQTPMDEEGSVAIKQIKPENTIPSTKSKSTKDNPKKGVRNVISKASKMFGGMMASAYSPNPDESPVFQKALHKAGFSLAPGSPPPQPESDCPVYSAALT